MFTETRSYDDVGNLVSRTNPNDVTTSYTDDKSDRLVEVKKNGQTIGQYFHDGDGKRLKKIESGVTTIYIYRGLTVLYEKVLENSTVTKYVFGPSGIVAKVKGGSTTYFHQDHLGSTRLVTDSNGAAVFDRNYRPFGTE